MSDKDAMLERLSRRDAQRLEKLQKAHKAREDVDACDENEEYFAGAFKTKSQYIEDLLTQIPTIEVSIVPSHFTTVKKEITELQKYVITSSLFLKEFNMRKYLGIVQNLQTKCYELEERFVPRKKFGFTKKKIPKCEQKSPTIDEHDTGTKSASKWDEKLFGFDTRSNEVLQLESEDVFQRDVALRHLKNCTVSLKGVLGTLHLTDLENCIVLCGPVTSSVFMERCTGCKLVVACQQLRMHSSTKCDIYLHVTSKGIIEDCSEIRTAPYYLHYEELDKHFKMSLLNRNCNNWDSLDDFNWLAPDVPSPNWSKLDIALRITNWDEQWSKIPY